ncbi:hypothetical protein EVA_14723 [gut metagenome]|uniref:Uncharacterized protein n=1 Tax=gut metagenome TaxID=749906 RepID=J9FQF3_9ZZZZ
MVSSSPLRYFSISSSSCSQMDSSIFTRYSSAWSFMLSGISTTEISLPMSSL